MGCYEAPPTLHSHVCLRLGHRVVGRHRKHPRREGGWLVPQDWHAVPYAAHPFRPLRPTLPQALGPPARTHLHTHGHQVPRGCCSVVISAPFTHPSFQYGKSFEYPSIQSRLLEKISINNSNHLITLHSESIFKPISTPHSSPTRQTRSCCWTSRTRC